MPANINSVVLVGNLTRDPELRHTRPGWPSARSGWPSRRKDESGNWTDKPNYFDITVWGAQERELRAVPRKGRPVGIQAASVAGVGRPGRDQRQAVEVVADNVQFLGSRGDGDAPGGQQFVPPGAAQSASADFPAAAADDDIPF